MADTVTSQIIVNGNRNLVMKFTNESDGTGESGVKKVDAASSTIATSQGIVPGVHLTIARVTFAVQGGSLRMQWDASSATDIDILEYTGVQDYTFFGGLTNPKATGATGSILFTTVGFVAGSSYTIILEMLKNV
jgi:hypothetical protein